MWIVYNLCLAILAAALLQHRHDVRLREKLLITVTTTLTSNTHNTKHDNRTTTMVIVI